MENKLYYGAIIVSIILIIVGCVLLGIGSSKTGNEDTKHEGNGMIIGGVVCLVVGVLVFVWKPDKIEELPQTPKKE